MKYFHKFSLTALIATLPFLSFAHEGHGVMTGSSLIHYMLSPMHAISVGIAVVILVVFVIRKRQTSTK